MMQWSHLDPPESFPKTKRLWVGHPKIAEWIIRVLKWATELAKPTPND